MTGGTTHYDTDTHWGWNADSFKITHYRLHEKEKYKHQFCESVMRSIPEPDEQVWTNPPSIEQLAADYRNAKDYADFKQQEADDAKADADARLKTLELAGEDIGLLVSPITAKQEPELVITDWRDLQAGDIVEFLSGTLNDWVGREVTVERVDTRDTAYPVLVRDPGGTRWCRDFRFIRRPAQGDVNA